MKFDQDTVYPGNDVSFNLKASPGSLCSVGVVDKSINLLGGDHQLTPEQVTNLWVVVHSWCPHAFLLK